MLGIGRKDCDQYKALRKLTSLNKTDNLDINTVHSGYGYNIYSNNHNHNNNNHHHHGINNNENNENHKKNKKSQNRYWCTGVNERGECGIKTANKKNAIKQYKEITYFRKNNIKIKKLCVNTSGHSTFWISDNNSVYGNGRNDYGQLGIGDIKHRYQPTEIEYFNNYNVIDIQSALAYSIALCTTNTSFIYKITKNWSEKQHIPNDIISIIVMFYNINTVHSTGYSNYIIGNGHRADRESSEDAVLADGYRSGHYSTKSPNYYWKKITFFNDKNIIKIRTGRRHSLFLDNNGTIWSCGRGFKFQLGLSHPDDVYIPRPITFFLLNNIRIKDMKCGDAHNLCIDINDRVYSWGCNDEGQCGQYEIKVNVGYVKYCLPGLIEYFKDLRIKEIDCGFNHSYIEDINGKHYLFGSNAYHECIKYDKNIFSMISHVDTPYRVDQVIKQKSNGKGIRSISLGLNNTKIVLCDD